MDSNSPQRPNLLLLSIEDLNDYIAPLNGHPDVITPNLTRLAERGVLFGNTFAAAPACSPARTAVLFGRAPWESGIYTNQQKWFNAFDPGRDRSLYGHFKAAGFDTYGAGKLFYGGIIEDEWTAYFREPLDPYPRMSPMQKAYDIKAGMLDYGPSDEEGPLYDERNAAHILPRLTPGATGQVWSLGIYRPHLPFIAPRRFFDLYPEQVSPAPALKERLFDPFSEAEVEGLPPEARNRIVRKNPFGQKLHASQQYNAFLRAYLASISYADFVLGQVLDRLDETGLAANTYIALWSDHGYHFGEKNVFHKFSLWERSLRTPMFFAGPDIAPRRVMRPVSNTDLGPTLLGLLGIPAGEFGGGQDLRPVLAGGSAEDLPPVLSAYGFRIPKARGDDEHVLAWSVRSESHRLVRYWNGGLELYDHHADPHEHHNLVPKARAGRVPLRLRGTVRELNRLIPKTPAPVASDKLGRVRANAGLGDYPHWVQAIV